MVLSGLFGVERGSMTVVLIGAKGKLGGYLYRDRRERFDGCALSRAEVDLGDEAALLREMADRECH